jgi:hypothetical protein
MGGRRWFWLIQMQGGGAAAASFISQRFFVRLSRAQLEWNGRGSGSMQPSID